MSESPKKTTLTAIVTLLFGCVLLVYSAFSGRTHRYVGIHTI